MIEQQQLEQAIIAQESLRGMVDDTIIDASITALRKQLAELEYFSLDERRKQVTVVFADLAGFTAMSERMDPEEVRAIQQAYFSAVTPAIKKFGGAIEKYIGDAVLAVFGLPQARENDPENAIRAALEMQAALGELNNDLNSQRGMKLAMRIGVNTGMVLATVGQGENNFLVTGDPVNLASRLESASPNGGVLISHNTYRHIQGLFDVQVLEPISVKGKVEPVQVYLVEGGKPKLFRPVSRGVEGVKASLVGREEEFQFLKDRRLAVFQDKELQMVTVIGDAGVGKSRLLYEFEKQSERDLAEIYVYRGRATRETRNQPYGLLRNLYAYYCTIQDSDPIVDVCHKVNTCLLDILDASEEGQMKSHFIGHLLGYDFCSSPYLADVLDDPQQIFHRARIYLEEFFRRSARLAPTMILLEDIHWADDSSLDLIQRLANELRNEPLLIVCLARPSLFERHTRWGEDQVYHHRLVLASLTGMDCQRLVKEILKNVERIPQELLDLIVHRADGNPFYVEELIKMMIEEGVILTSGERWQVDTSRLQELRVPPTLTGVLQARLERLPEPEQTVLQEASVVGRMFWDQAIHHIMQTSNEQGDETNIPRALDALGKREMIFRRELSSIADAEEYIFKHALLREVTYESVLKRLRRIYHSLVADWLIKQSGGRSVEISGLIAEHLELSSRKIEAADYFIQAARQASARYANNEATKYFQRAITLLQGLSDGNRQDEVIAHLNEEMGDVQGLLQQKLDAQTSYQRALAILPDTEGIWQARLHRKIGNYFEEYKPRKHAYDLAESALGATPARPETQWWHEWINIYIERIWICYVFVQVDDFVGLRDKTQPVIEEQGTPAQHARFLSALVAHNNLSHRFSVTEESVINSRGALEIIRQTGNLRSIAGHQFSLGFNLLFAGDLQAAEANLLAALELGNKVGDAWTQTASSTYLAICYRMGGDLSKVRQYAELGLQMALTSRLNSYIGMGKANLAWLALKGREYDQAEAGCLEALNIPAHTNNPFNWCALFPLIQIAVSNGELDRAVDYLAQLMDPLQMRLPDELSLSAEGSIAAWKTGQKVDIPASLHRTLELAKVYGYL